MNLFVINRYEDKEWQRKNTDSENHLSKLLKKIEERKRQRENTEGNILNVQISSPTEFNDELSKAEIKKNKNKGVKRKLDSSDKIQNDNILNKSVADVNKEEIDVKSDDSYKANFTILGSQKRRKIQIAKRVLPSWLLNPEIVNYDLKSGPKLSEVETYLDLNLLEKLKEDGFNQLFPVQSEVFSWLLKCDQDYKLGRWVRDTCVSMPTGSGKTLAYVLPIIQLLQNNFVRLLRCLIVLPVQELAAQVYEIVTRYSSSSLLKVALISGATSFKDEQEKLVQKTENGTYISRIDIVIATPGRLIDHIKKTSGFSLTALRFLVIDEADRCTDWLQYIPFPHQRAPTLTINNVHSNCNIPAQKLLLSATLSQDPEKLSRLGLFKPKLFTSTIIDFEKINEDLNLDQNVIEFSSKYGNPSELTERIMECENQVKPLAVCQLLLKNTIKTLVFTNSSESAHRLAVLLQFLLEDKNIVIGELSAQLSTKQREETLEKFKKGTLQVLVSSDALARGLDIPKIKLVVSYDLPKHIKGYIHRAGRTGRGGIPGTAVSLVTPGQTALFKRMLKKVGKLVPEVEKENLNDISVSLNYNNHLDNLKTFLIDEQKITVHRLKYQKRLMVKK